MNRIKTIIIIMAIVFVSARYFIHDKVSTSNEPIRVGILHSLSGTMAISEKSVADATLMAIEEINNAGGIHGAQLEPIVRDPQSRWANYAKYAKELMNQNVNIFWAGYTSASREAILPVIERGGALLYYSTHYEGGECSPNMIAHGAQPNHQVYNSVPWIVSKAGSKAYMVGSDYIYPRVMNKEAIFTLKKAGGRLVGDKYIDLNVDTEDGFKAIIADIMKKKPDFVYSNMIGVSTVAFMRAYKKAGLTKDNLPIISCALYESQIPAVGIEYCEGHYNSIPYFQSVQRVENQEFIQRYQAFHDAHPEWQEEPVVTDAVMEAAYVAAQSCAEAMRIADSAHPQAIIEASRGLTVKAPEEDIKIDPDNLHAWLRPRIGRINSSGQFDILDEAPALVRPQVFSAELDPGKVCNNGGITYINEKEIPRRKSERVIIPQ